MSVLRGEVPWSSACARPFTRPPKRAASPSPAATGKVRGPALASGEPGRVEVVQLLLAARADAEGRDKDGHRPLDLALAANHEQAAA